MADNVESDAGSGGAIFATDQMTVNGVADVHLPWSKLGYGTYDAFTPVTLTDGLPVQPGTGTTWAVSAASLPLPTGAATAANQATGNASLSSIDGKITACNTGAVVVSSMPTVAVTGTFWQATQPVSGTFWQATQPVSLASVPSHAVTNAGTFAVQAAQSGTWTVDLGATDNAVLDAIAASLAGTLTVGSHAVTNAGTFAVQAAQSGTWNITNISGTISLPTGAATETTLSALNTKVTACNTGAVVISSGTVTAVTAITNALPAGTNNIGDVDVLTLPGAAHDAAVSGNPVRVGARAETSLSGITLVADGDTTDLYAGVDGVQITRPHCNLEDIVSGVAAITDGSSTSVIASAGAGVKVYITSVVISNSSATAVTVDLRDGAAGTVKATYPVPANTAGVVHSLPVPIPFSAATAVCADPSAAASTVTVTLVGFKSKV